MLPYDRIEYTLHARIRLAERAIPPTLVSDVLSAPDITYEDRGSLDAERVLADGKPWRVVFVEATDAAGTVARIVTVHRIDRITGRDQP